MKFFKTILIIILSVLVIATTGFTSRSKTLHTSNPDISIDCFSSKMPGEINWSISQVLNSYASIINNSGMANEGMRIKPQATQGSVDFRVSNSDLTIFTTIAEPGDSVYFKVRVYNNTPDKGICGGSTVRFIMNGKAIDEVPFFLKSGEVFSDVYSHIYLPEGEYSVLAPGQQTTVQMQAIIDPYNKIPESNEDNNSASSQFNVEGVYSPILQGINPGITVDVEGLSAFSIKNNVPGGKINAALPRQILYLKARIKYNDSVTMDDINIKFVLNGIVIKDIDRPIYGIPTAGYFEIYTKYYVPVNAVEPLDFSVLLNNGSQARIKIPVLRWDLGINKGDMGWSGEVSAVPGKNIYLKAVIKNITSMELLSNTNTLGYKVLIDGALFYENSFSLGYYYSIYPNIPAYKVPADRTTPIQYTFIVDSYDQIDESDETKNAATIIIPIQNTGSTGPDFSISAGELSYISKPLIPGSQVKLSAAILNNSKSYLLKDLHVHFKINGNILLPELTIGKELLKPLQYYTVTKEWNVPQDLPDNSVFEVVLDPAVEFTGENDSDNKASIILDTYGPDLEVTADCLTWSPQDPKAGEDIILYAAVRNAGIIPVKDCSVSFILDGNSVGEDSVPLIAGASGSIASLLWEIPPAPELAPITWSTLQGVPSKTSIPKGATKDYKFKVEVDPGKQIKETNENNNIPAERNLTVYVPYNKGVVYIRVFDDIGNVNIADVELKTAGGTSAKTFTDENGWCTFTGVPFGSYTITVKKEKYEDLIYSSQTAEGRLTNVNELKLIRKSEFPYFSATASTLEGITALKVDFNCNLLDADRMTSNYTYEWRDWADPIDNRSSFGYEFVEPKVHRVYVNVHNEEGIIVFTKSFDIKVNPPIISIIDGGRKIVSVGSIFVNPFYDVDHDSINQAWENLAMNEARPRMELDEKETLLKEPSHKVVNFVRITPFVSNANRNYIIFTYGIVWSKDYGRYGLLAHNGDIEKVVMAWEVINNKTLQLRWVYTSAHNGEDTDHSGVWKAIGETTQVGKVIAYPDDEMKATLEFVQVRYNITVLKVYASQDKHAIYPTEACGESAHLIFIPYPVPWFVMEDVGSDGLYQYRCASYNIGEENAHLIDSIANIFPNESIWSGNTYNPGKFCGGLDYRFGINGIGGNLSGLPGKLESVLNNEAMVYW